MIERCICCKARLTAGSDQCSRCKADLKLIVGSEKAAKFWLSQAVRYWLEGNVEQSIIVLEYSLCLKETKVAVVFRHFIVQKKCQTILALLEKKQWLAAKRQLCSVQTLFGSYRQLQILNSFTDYLLVKG